MKRIILNRIIISLLFYPLAMMAMEQSTPFKLLTVCATFSAEKRSKASPDLQQSYTLTGARLHSSYPNSPTNNACVHTDKYNATLSLHGLEQNNAIIGCQVFTKDNILIYTQQRMALSLSQPSHTQVIKHQENTVYLTIITTLQTTYLQ